MKKLLLFSFSLILLFCADKDSIAQNLALNDSFGLGGVGHCGHETYLDNPGELLYQPDGKFILVGDSYDRSTNQWYIVICRFNPNGNLDSSFGTEGIVLKKNGFRSIGRGAGLQADGKILVVGSENTSNGSSSITAAVYRFNADGSDDTDFGSNGTQSLGFNGEFFDTEETDDGKIVVMGTNYGSRTSQIFRLFSDGSQDTTFSTDGRTTRGPSAMFATGYDAKIAPNGNIMALSVRIDGSTIKPVLTSTRPDGEPDDAFNGSGSVFSSIISLSNQPVALDVDADNNVYIAATILSSDSKHQMIVEKYNPDGNLDSSFGNGGQVIVGVANVNLTNQGVTVGSSGAIYVLGGYSAGFGVGIVAKLDANGNLDSSFQGDGLLLADINSNSGTHWAEDVIEDPDGSIYLSAWDFASRAGDMAIAKFTPMVNTSIEVPFDQTKLEIYPNPSSNVLFVSGDIQEGFDRLEIFDALGRLVSSQEIANQEINRISTADLPKGNYYARISGDKKHATQKIVVL